MRVLMLSWEYPPHNIGGLSKHVTELAPALIAAGIEVHLLTPAWLGGAPIEPLAEKPNNSRVYRVTPPPEAHDLADFFSSVVHTNGLLERQANELIRETGPFDLIHAHDWLVGPAAWALKHMHRTPLVATIHATEWGRSRGHLGSDMQRAINSVEWWLTYEAWRVICCSAYMAEEVRTIFETPPDKIDVVPNGVDTARFDRWDGIDLAAFRVAYARPDEEMLLYVGRIVAEKGADVLVEALPRVRARRPSAKAVFVGAGVHLSALRARAELLVGPHVLFTGFVSDDVRDRLLKVADVAVFPSLYEPFGIVALEAMAARAPVVAAAAGGLREVVRPHETGILVAPGDPDSLAWGILHTLEHADWTAARVASAYRSAREEFAWSRIAAGTCAVYERVVRARQRVVW
ncbi:MAG: glycosyltransferase family 4 protein [Chloroflexi bacterium]|nr:glycosyltransferase family 4 protein [Chloroflexota bacterium]